jgi:CheY-like chemotaxis protein
MGGDIHINSEVGKGTICTFDIQVQIPEVRDMQPVTPSRRVIVLEPGQPRYRMLIVDDKKDNRQLLMKLFAVLGQSDTNSALSHFDLQEAENGQEAINIWETWQPHVIWMDMRMPVMDGYEATKRIKSEILRSKSEIQTIIIAVTASSFEEEREIVLSAGCDDFLRKPFKETEIIEMLHKHVGVRFVYEAEGPSEAGGHSREIDAQKPWAEITTSLTPEAFAGIPADVLLRLKDAATEARMIDIDREIAEIETHKASLAAALRRLACEFAYDQILVLLEDVVEEKG